MNKSMQVLKDDPPAGAGGKPKKDILTEKERIKTLGLGEDQHKKG